MGTKGDLPANVGPADARRHITLVDADLAGDRRVLMGLAEPAMARVIDLRNAGGGAPAGWLDRLRLGVFMWWILRWPLRPYRLLRPYLVGRVDRRLTAGWLQCLRWLRMAIATAGPLRRELRATPSESVLHAHDLYCGVAAALAIGRRGRRTQLIYDAHELEIHRHRKAGWLRVLLERGLEQFVLTRASEVRVVNNAIADVMRAWYKIHAPIRVVYNNFYAPQPVVLAPPSGRPALIYVGMGVRGRQLERLDAAGPSLGCDVHLYLLGSKLPPHVQGHGWIHGPVAYEASLYALVRRQRSLMWCCLDRQTLSYELATPNKFFQALAIGIPVVAAEGTYLASLVQIHDIGLVLRDDEELLGLGQITVGPHYIRWVRNVQRLRERLDRGEVRL